MTINIDTLSRAVTTVDALASAAAPTEIAEQLSLFLLSFGFQHILITGLPGPRTGNWQAEILHDGWPQEWFDHYAASALFEHDPCASRSRKATTPFFWSEISYRDMTKDEVRVMEEAKDFKLAAGLCVPQHGPLRAPSVITAAGDAIEVGSHEMPLIEMVCVEAFRSLCRSRVPVAASPPKELTPREREVLTWMGAGKTAEDVACILAISKLTVERHLSNIREKNGATNTLHAVTIALQRGDIYP